MLDERLVTNICATGKFVTVTFLTKSGEERTYNGRFNVKKYLKGTDKSETVSRMLRKNNLIPIWVDKDTVKSFKPDRVLEMVSEGRRYCGLGRL